MVTREAIESRVLMMYPLLTIFLASGAGSMCCGMGTVLSFACGAGFPSWDRTRVWDALYTVRRVWLCFRRAPAPRGFRRLQFCFDCTWCVCGAEESCTNCRARADGDVGVSGEGGAGGCDFSANGKGAAGMHDWAAMAGVEGMITTGSVALFCCVGVGGMIFSAEPESETAGGQSSRHQGLFVCLS